MATLKETVEKFDVDSTKNLVSETELSFLEKNEGFEIGVQLKEYILNYGYLGYESIEFYGINSIQKEKSDLILQTKYLHKYFPVSNEFVAFENCGEGDYAIVDKNDNVCLLRTEDNQKVVNLQKKLFEYIEQRFSEE